MRPAPPIDEKELPAREAAADDGQGRFSDLLRELAAAPLVSPKTDRDSDARRLPAIGRFRLIRELGRGAGGIVYEARDTELGRRVAVKLVGRRRAQGPRPPARAREVESAAQLSHPNIAALFDVGQCDRGPYLVRELLRGECLGSRLERGPASMREALSIATEVARGLAHAHAQGVIHRDLTPESVFLGADGSVKVLDFGVASAYGRRSGGEGSLAYLPPEQGAGATEDERGDVFSLGVMLYRMLSGALPFRGEPGIPAQGGPPAPPLAIAGAPALVDLVGRMVDRDPLRRPRTGDEVLAALEAIREGQRPRRRSPRRAPGPRPLRRAALWIAAALVSAAAVLRVATAGLPSGSSRSVVVVADFENPTGDRDLDGLAGLLIASLEQSPSLTVLTRARLLDVARQCGHGRVERIDGALGREVAQKAGASAVLAPAVRRRGGSYLLELRAVEPKAGASLFPLTIEAASKDAILSAIDGLSEGVRRALGEPAQSIERARVPLRDVAGTLEAYRHYFEGQQRYSRGDYGEAKKAYERALEVDPGFALAHVELYLIALMTSAGDEVAAAHLRAALAGVDRLPDKFRRLILLAKADADFDASGGRERGPVIRHAEELAASYPMDKDVLFTAARSLWMIRGKDGRGRSLELLRQVLLLDPVRLDAAEMLVLELLAARRCDEAVSVARGLAAEPGPVAPRLLAYSLACSGRAEEALAAARRAAERGVASEEALVYVLPAARRFDEAEELLARLTSEGADPTLRRLYLPKRVMLLALLGRRREALALMDRTEGMAGAFWDHARKGAMDAGEGALWRIDDEADFPRDREENRALIRGDGARREGRLGEAIAIYREFVAELRLEAQVINDGFLAELLLEAGRPAEALEQLGGPERALLALSPSAAPRSFYLRALAYERLGQRERASEELDGLFALWSRADPDLPLLARANELRSRLERARAGDPH